MTKPSEIVAPSALTPLYPLLILAGIFLVRLYLIGTYPLMDTTEARYADVARWMYATGDYITPRYPGGEPFWGKPPLSFWFTAISFKVLGLNEFAARLPSLLFSVGTVFLTYISAKRLFGKSSALTSAIILSSSATFFAVSGLVLTDTVLTFCTTLSMASIVMVFTGDGGRAGKLWGYAFFLGIGLGLLAKGPVALVLILLSLFVWALWKGRVITLWRMLPWVSGILFMLLISVPWYIAAEIKTPGFLEYYFIGEHFLRFIEPGWSGDLYGNAHTSRKGVIWLYYMAALLPWIFLLAAALFKLMTGGERLRESFGALWGEFFLCWTLAPVVFFTMAGNVLPTYVLPAIPAFSILTGVLLSRALSLRKGLPIPVFLRPKALYLYAVIIPVLFVITTVVVLPDVSDKKSQKKVGDYLLTRLESDQDRIFYLDKLTFSADFYNNGRAEVLKDEDFVGIIDLINGEGRSFFVIKNDLANIFLNYVTDSDVKEDVTFANFTIYVEL